MRSIRLVLAAGLAALVAVWVGVAETPLAQASREAKVDALFARWTSSTPGCAVGVGGRIVLERAYGMADLEHDVPNRPDTIFEAGSVSKQFTAAAVLLLARDGKLSLDDPVRRYVPELPDYGVPLTIRHMLTHTSGLRDWGSLAGIAGWPRGSRVHTHAHVLEILSRQRALNFTPGTRYSYSNSGYNLSAVIVSRASGMSFGEFTRQRIFEPLGMTRTSWRDDYTRIVKDRAIAYAGGGSPAARGRGAARGGAASAPGRGGARGAGVPGGGEPGRVEEAPPFRMDMPFENVHGNGGLLTTVGDLLRWNENFVTPKVGDASFVAEQQATGTFPSGAPQRYALGLMIGSYQGLREVSHSGSTAGYRAFLTRFPDQHVSVAVLCNAASANAAQLAHAVAELYLGDRLDPRASPPPAVAEARGPTADLTRDESFKPDAARLAEYAGVYHSDEIETSLIVEVRGDALVVRRRPDTTITLRPHSPDRFEGGGLGLVTFHRRDGRVVELGVTQDRVWDLRFVRGTGATSSAVAGMVRPDV